MKACGVVIREDILCLFSKVVGVRDFNEAKVLAILEAFGLFSFNAISWAYIGKSKLGKLQFFFNEIKVLNSYSSVVFANKLDQTMV